jgi:hypothetical protein
MGLNVMRVRERFAQSDDWSRIGEVLLDTSDHFLWPIRIGFCPTSGGGPHPQDYSFDSAERARRIAGILNPATADMLSE